MNTSQKLFQLGQSIWFDNVDRSLLNNGWFESQIHERTFYGVTSNPSIFQKAISSGTAYTLDIQTMSWSGLDTKTIYENLVVEDIRHVADLLEPIYDETGKKDGYVSLEVDPQLANNSDGTIKEAKRLWDAVGRDNLMIKIPATPAGISAIKEVIAEGINVNVTLIFSAERYDEVLDAYYSGLEKRMKAGREIHHIHSVASFFISRMDVMIENVLSVMEKAGTKLTPEVKQVFGKIAIQNGLNAYALFEDSIASDRFKKIEQAGGNLQRPLWASTGTKNPEYPDVHYVDGLLLPHTVNTVPPATLNALLDHGKDVEIKRTSFRDDFQHSKKTLEGAGINFETVYADLESEGVEKFTSAQEKLLKTIENERQLHQNNLAIPSSIIQNRIKYLEDQDHIHRFFLPDARIFTSNPAEEEEVLNRMGWIDAPEKNIGLIRHAMELLEDITNEGFTHAVVLGMGGSSLAPEVFAEVFKVLEKERGLELSILDSTDPDQIKAKHETIPVDRTLFIASSKSGTTAEMKSLVSYFINVLQENGVESPGRHFICITDPNTPLETLARENQYRAVFQADASVGGRYSALTAFGIIPAILAGIDGEKLLSNGNLMMKKCGRNIPNPQNPAFILAGVLSEVYRSGKDKLTIITDKQFSSFGSWLEQLIAESSGKNGMGLIPIDLEPQVNRNKYSDDRQFFYLRSDGSHDQFISQLADHGFNVVISHIGDPYQVASEMYKWEMATAFFCTMIGVNPFNQPNVQASKSLAVKMIEEYKASPVFFEGDVLFENDSVLVYGNSAAEIDSIDGLLSKVFVTKPGDYFSLNAFIPRTQTCFEILNQYRKRLIEKFSIPTTLGFGPRFLHSTGQLHKGGKNNGIFIVLTQTPENDFEIPGEGIPFSVLEKSQALGDMRALIAHNRRVVRVHFKDTLESDVLESIT